jgi:uncharacterized protein (AIM24 family)
MSLQSFTAHSLPVNDNVNPYAFCVDLNGQYFVQKGKMIAYYGNIKFEALSVGSLSSLVASHFSSPLYHSDWIVASGQGKLILGDRGFDINSFDLDDGNLTVRASSLLGFEATLQLKQSVVPGFLTLIGTGKFLASSNGAVHFVVPPVRVDPQALVGWADCPSPCHHYDHAYMQGVMGMMQGMLGMGSGEEHQLDFTGEGTVLVQSSEEVDDTGVLRELQSQVPALGIGGLQSMQASINQRLMQEGQNGY